MHITIRSTDVARMIEHALSVRPEEACGLIAGRDLEDGTREIEEVFLLTNIDHTNEHFTIYPKDQLRAIKEMRAKGLTPLGN